MKLRGSIILRCTVPPLSLSLITYKLNSSYFDSYHIQFTLPHDQVLLKVGSTSQFTVDPSLRKSPSVAIALASWLPTIV